MKLREMRIKNFRSIGEKEVILKMNDILFLIGKNSAGKSNLLEVYEFFLKTNNVANKYEFNKKDTSKTIRIELVLKLSSEQINKMIDHKMFRFESFISDEETIKLSKSWSGNNCWIQMFDYQNNVWVPKQFISTIISYIFSLLPIPVRIKGMDKVDETINEFNQLYDFMWQQGIAIKGKGRDLEIPSELVRNSPGNKKIEDRINNLVRKVFKNIIIIPLMKKDTDLGDGENSRIMIEERKGVDPKDRINITRMGDAVKRQLILANLIYKDELEDFVSGRTPAPKNKILFIEEPELFAHPETIRDIRDMLYEIPDEPNYQVICTTHSPIIIDLAKQHSTYVRVVKDVEGTSIHQVTQDLFNESSSNVREKMKMLNYFDPYVCEAFFTDKVLLVEGDTEYTVVNFLLQKLKEEDCLQSHENIHVVKCGSKTNIPFFQKVLRYFGISYNVFHDLDYTYTKNCFKNSAWTFNKSIWDEVEEANSNGVLAARYIFKYNFEIAHEYTYNASEGKPYSALKHFDKLNYEDIKKGKNIPPVINYILDIFGECTDSLPVFDMTYVDENSTAKPEK
ncbi:ATP-dependent nuclease [Bacillus cereus]|uniref:ATP-dependent nuclease n=1 Tax=Bacillus cereus TaxID=1396 RepID=UPI000944F91F|nr:AAA family ATPase [Bacillus cereus]